MLSSKRNNNRGEKKKRQINLYRDAERGEADVLPEKKKKHNIGLHITFNYKKKKKKSHTLSQRPNYKTKSGRRGRKKKLQTSRYFAPFSHFLFRKSFRINSSHRDYSSPSSSLGILEETKQRKRRKLVPRTNKQAHTHTHTEKRGRFFFFFLVRGEGMCRRNGTRGKKKSVFIFMYIKRN